MSVQILDDNAAFIDAIANAIQQSRLHVDILSQTLPASIYGQPVIVQAVRRLVLRTPRAHVRILLRDAAAPTRETHALIALARKVSSRISIRILSEVDDSTTQEWIVGDGNDLVSRHSPRDRQARWIRNEAGRRRASQAKFQCLWEAGAPAGETRELNL